MSGLALRQIPAWERDYALLLLNAEGEIAAWYSGTERIYGFSGAESIGQHVASLYPDEDTPRVRLQAELERAAAAGHFGNEGWSIKKDGTRFGANVVTTALKDESGELQGFARVVRDFSQRSSESGAQLSIPRITGAGLVPYKQRLPALRSHLWIRLRPRCSFRLQSKIARSRRIAWNQRSPKIGI